jgi:hypothetical protein
MQQRPGPGDAETPDIGEEVDPVPLREHPVFQDRINTASWIYDSITEKADMSLLMIAIDDNEPDELGRLIMKAVEDYCGDDLEDAVCDEIDG